MRPAQLATFAANLRLDLEEIDRSLADMAEARKAAGEAPGRVALWACGGTLHAFYTGIEKLFETIAVSMDGGTPSGPDCSKHVGVRALK